jgi:CRISPR-associated protein Cas2
MLEVRAGVFVGTLSARVRDKLWTLIRSRNLEGGAVLVFRANNEQGFVAETDGDTSRAIFDMEGLLVVWRPLEGAEPPKPEAQADARPKRRARAARAPVSR